jgi:hypothetical protein
MTYTSDMQLRAQGLKPLADLPNKHWFGFIGRMRTSHERDCYVAWNATKGTFGVIGCEFGDLIGWRDRRQ